MSTTRASRRRLATTPCLVLSLVALTSLPVVCQNIQNPQSAVDNLTRSSLKVDPSTGALQLEVPLHEFRGRGEASLPVALKYSSKLWNIKYMNTLNCNGEPVSSYHADYAKSSASGWTSSVGWFLPSEDLSMESYEGQTQQPATVGNPNLYRIMRKYVTLPDGSRHELRRDDSLHSFGASESGVYFAVDGSRMWWDWTNSANHTLFLPNGSRIVTINGSRQYIDRNGNLLTFNNSTSTWTDTLGRSIGVPFGGTAPAAGDYTYTLPGGLTYTLRWRNLGDVLTDPTQPLRYKGDQLISECVTGSHQPNALFSTVDDQRKVLRQGGIFNPVVLWQIGLPNNTAYTFTYNVYGELDKIVYPTGGSETFGYGVKEPLGGQLDDGTNSQANRGVTSRVVSDGITTQPAWGYGGAPLGVTGVDPATAARSVTAPDGTVTATWYYQSRADQIKYGFDDARTGMPREVRVYNSAGTMLRRSLNWWTMDGAQAGGYSTATRNARVTKTVEIILDTGGNALAATTEMTYDSDLNVTSTKRYDYVAISQAVAQTGDIPSIPNGTLIRTEETDYLTNDANYRARNLLSLPTSTRVKNGAGTIVAQSSFSYDEAGYPLLPCGATAWIDPATTARGNATTSGSWLNTTGAYLQTHAQYDQCGSVRYGWDAKGNQSQVEYSSAYAYAYPTLTRTPVPDPTGQRGSATALVRTSVYDFNTGQVTSTTDANNVTTTFEYNDIMDRLSRTVRASGTVVQNQTSVSYDDVNRIITTTSDLDAFNDPTPVKSQILYDGLGRTTETRQYETATTYVTTRQTYDTLGRPEKVSNPYRSGETLLWTTTNYDDLGRTTSVQSPDNATVNTSYSGNTVTATDQAGKDRKSTTDALGRLTQVIEDPGTGGLGYATSYAYDVLGNLNTVTQGSQTRTFTYDSLSRLKTAANPESGTLTYTYDNNGNLLTKTDARAIITTFTYDALNRATLKNYSDTTPDVAYFYDNAPLPAGAPSFVRGPSTGRLVAVTYGTGSSAGRYRGYDAAGQVVRQYQRTDSVNYLVEATYNKAGAMLTETYPSVPGAGDRRTVTYTSDAAGRLASLNTLATSYAPAASVSGISYAASGGLSSETYGNNLIHGVVYNNRLQPNQIKLGTAASPTSVVNLTYNYGTTNNNGNVQSLTYAGGGLSYTQTFGYDQLNRLTTSQEGASWSQTNSYDRYGNRAIVGSGMTFSANNNRITNAGYTYDLAGNLLTDGAHVYTYDAENKISKVDAVSAYVYDGEGQRVRKLVGENLRFIYGIGGQQIAEFSGSTAALKKEYIYGASGLVATIEPTAVNANGTRYTTSDHLGSPRVVTASSAAVVSRHDFKPFGEELGSGIGGRTPAMGYGVLDGLRQKFTSKERDNETGLDYFEARYYSSAQGRFTGADGFFKDSQVSDPQSWNKYAYGRNNPLKYIDPEGEKATVKIVTDEKNRTGTITITASIALYTNDQNISAKDLNKAAQEYKKNIEEAWSGSYEQNGITYTVNTTVEVAAYGNEQEATQSRALNVLEVVPSGSDTFIRPAPVFGGPDRGQIEVNAGRRGLASHEFTHLLGVDDRFGGAYLSNTYESQRGSTMHATAYDYGWALGGAINNHRAESRSPIFRQSGDSRQFRWSAAASHTSTRELRAGKIWWH